MTEKLKFLPSLLCMLALIITISSSIATPARAQDAPADAKAGEGAEAPAAEEKKEEAKTPETLLATLRNEVNTLWTCIAAFLVFFMQAGFALVETGFTRSKNACNIIMKNLMDLSIGSLAFWLVGFGLMFGVTTNGFYGSDSFVFDAGGDSFNWAFLIFQTVFCATAATIVSGAMAERTKFSAYLLYTLGISIIVYPIFGKWAWGSLMLKDAGAGWLEGKSFYDFAGSTVVHSVGGWAALAGAIVLGARIGKYSKDGKSNPMPGHNIPLAALGVFILWLGWFGFNPGSTTQVDGGSFAYIAVTTNIAAAAGAIGAMLISWLKFGKPDTSFALNGALAGLVTITAGCPILSLPGAAIAGAIGGVLCVFAVLFFDKLKIDDPVGAISVHGVCGAWGTLAVGLFACPDVAGNKIAGLFYGGNADQMIAQCIGVAACFLWVFPVSFAIFYVIKMTIGLRVSEADELEGLDISEHGMHAYPPALVAADS
jgi:Amt family ammonium transporter